MVQDSADSNFSGAGTPLCRVWYQLLDGQVCVLFTFMSFPCELVITVLFLGTKEQDKRVLICYHLYKLNCKV